MNDIDKAWLAGLLEGEGWFGWRSKKNTGWPIISVQMTDSDVVERAAKLMGCPTVWAYQPPAGSTSKKASYKATIYGSKAATLMGVLLQYMGERRSTKIRQLLERTSQRPGRWPEKALRCVS